MRVGVWRPYVQGKSAWLDPLEGLFKKKMVSTANVGRTLLIWVLRVLTGWSGRIMKLDLKRRGWVKLPLWGKALNAFYRGDVERPTNRDAEKRGRAYPYIRWTIGVDRPF